MSDIKCPTVVIKVPNMRFIKATVYYVLLEPKNGLFKGQICALMLSNPFPKGRNNITWTAELLPLVMKRSTMPAAVSLKPMLLFKRYKSIFEEGCIFFLKVIKYGRKFSPVDAKLLKKVLLKDIAKIPKDTLRTLKPLQLVNQRVKRISANSRSLWGVKQTSSFSGKLSELYTDLQLPGLKVRGHNRDFARWFATIPPDVVVDVNFKCDNGIWKKDNFQDLRQLDSYLGLTRMV